MSVTAYIALGSNLGDSKALIERAFSALEALSASPVRRSPVYASAPVDCPPGSPDFLNAVAGIVTREEETPETLLGRLQDLERQFGRQAKGVLNEARPLDLDLIAFGDETRSTPILTLPHPRAVSRRFVLAPLADLAPDLVLPGQTGPVSLLLRRLPPQGLAKMG